MCVKKSFYNCLLLLCGLWCAVPAAGDWTSTCPQTCCCEETEFKEKAVDCAERNLTAVPTGLSSQVQNIDLSENQIPSLLANTFKLLTSLINLNMARCQIKELDEKAFSGLSLLKSLNLNENEIRAIHPNTFRETTNLVSLFMDENPIEVLEDGLFTGLTSLKLLTFHRCKIKQLGVGTFDQLPNLSVLVLTNNSLGQISRPSIMSLSRLPYLYIYYNPWNCNCRLRDVRDCFISQQGSKNAPECAMPRHLRGRSWDEIDSSEFICTPYILYLPGNETVTAASENVTLSCTALGDHLPEMYWKTPSGEKLISGVKSTKYSIQKSKMAENNQSVVNLTISDIQADDAGTYTCVADNSKSKDEHYAYYTQFKVRHTESSKTIIVPSKKPMTHEIIPL